ncbi:Two-component response regulator-like [Dionaea muscipula]
MSDEGDGNKGLREEEGRVCGERRRVEIESVGVRQSFLDNEVSKGNLNGHDIKIGNEGVIWASAPGQVLPQQPSQGASVCWERFLNVRSLRVLLVENDDSTRHVVSALLRNCSYEVIEASNGIRAWKILEDITTHVDLVLTEVIMPCLSGIGLLCKIMSHKTRNIPVIMKPIRKNELKNLWQHVWRRCHSSSGSGSESGTQTHKYVRSKNADESDNSTSNGEEDNQSPLNFGDGSDHGSGAQSSWTKQAVDDQVDSSGLVSLVHGIAECPDSTCAQVIHPNAVPSVDKFMNVDECLEQKELLGNAEVDNEIDISPPKNLVLQLKVANVEVLAELSSMNLDTGPKIDANEANDQTFPMIFETNGSKELPFIEQSLKRPRGVQEVGKPVQDDRNVLRRSQSSAFSRYYENGIQRSAFFICFNE